MFVRITVLLLAVGSGACSPIDVVRFSGEAAKAIIQHPHDLDPAPITPPEEGSSSGNTGGPWDEDKTKKP